MKRRSVVRRSCAVAAVTLLGGLLATVGSATVASATGGTRSPSVQPTPTGKGYWEVASDGGIFSFGNGAFEGSMGGKALNAPVVGMTAAPTGGGYWEVAGDGGIFTFGNAAFDGSMGGKVLNAPVVGMAAAPTGGGYWEVASDGGIFSFGTAQFYGSMGGQALNAPIVGMVASPTGNGYWEVASDGGIFSFGSAVFYGSMGGKPLNQPIVGMAAAPTGNGYWEVASDGGIFSFGSAVFYGSMGGKPLNQPIVGMTATTTGNGYWEVASDGGIFSFGSAQFYGSMGGTTLNKPVVGMAPVGPTVSSDVLTVGTFDGHPGQFTGIQTAVNAAKPGDWILIAPGDYHPEADITTKPARTTVNDGWYGGVEISTPDLHIRGMSRSGVIVDGTKPGSPTACSSTPSEQNLGPTLTNGTGKTVPVGQNGIVVWKADNVSIQNLTVCNFLSVPGYSSGNEVWWNGGAGSSKIGMSGYTGSYLTATDSFDGKVNGVTGYGNYGIFSSDSAGPGTWNQIYANNFTDSGMYIGACQQACDAVVNHAWMENNGLGYSGTNSGGSLVVENSQFDNNADGFDTNTQSVGDPPPPQNGTCPDGGVSSITHTTSCWVFMNNYVHDNNNATVPGYGATGEPTGTGMTVSGATNDTIMNNLFENNGAWGTLFVPYPDTSPGGPGVCTGSGGHLEPALGACVYDPEGDALLNNTYVNDGFFGNASNTDYGEITFFKGEPQNCFAGNVAPQGSSPTTLEQTQPTCGALTTHTVSVKTLLTTINTKGALVNQVLCDTGFARTFGVTCTSTAHKYPTPGPHAPVMTTVPSSVLPSMPNPCADVPANTWCPGGKPL